MRTTVVLLGAAAVVALGATPATAGRLTGWYGVFEGGGSWTDDVEFQNYVTPTPLPVTATLELEQGWAGLASVGYAYSNNWRVELEGGYRHNELERVVNSAGVATPPVDGDLGMYTLMANVMYDFPSMSGVTLSLGAGAGAAYADLDADVPAPDPGMHDKQVSMAFQAVAGLSYEMTSWLDLVLNYRYLYTTDFEFSEVDPLAPANTSHIDTEDLQTHTVTMGLRFGAHKSDAPPMKKAAPPPPPPPSVARQFVIYFGFNKCSITADADAVLAEAASAANTLGQVAVKIVGHTDTVGSRQANQKLSECRAGAAKTNLVTKGIPAGKIAISGAGEGQLLIQTADAVKEPQNRRATIDLN